MLEAFCTGSLPLIFANQTWSSSISCGKSCGFLCNIALNDGFYMASLEAGQTVKSKLSVSSTDLCKDVHNNLVQVGPKEITIGPLASIKNRVSNVFLVAILPTS